MKQFNRTLGENMKSSFESAEDELRDIATSATQLANQLAAGALLGLTGDEFYNALATTLNTVVNDLADKMNELAGDVQDARDAYDEAERRARELFEQGLGS